MQPFATVSDEPARGTGDRDHFRFETLPGRFQKLSRTRGSTADANGVIIVVRHAQNIPHFEGDFEWAEVSVDVHQPTAGH